MKVTPCVGVWIETPNPKRKLTMMLVTPCVGVWIETNVLTSPVFETLSHPAWVCGLKPVNASIKRKPFVVTPCVGVWIETKSHFP